MLEMTQSQREALFDILALAIHADALVSLTEEDLIQQGFVQRGWKPVRTRTAFMEASFERAREAADSDDAMMDYLTERAAEFAGATAQKEARNAVRTVLETDGTPAEDQEFFHLFIQALPRVG